MEIAFASAELAALCNSSRHLDQRWGGKVGGLVSKRLLDLAASDASDLHALPGVQITVGEGGETTLEFDGTIEIRAMVERGSDGDESAGRMVVAAVAVARMVQR